MYTLIVKSRSKQIFDQYEKKDIIKYTPSMYKYQQLFNRNKIFSYKTL